jgi:hypothetical protein
MNRMKRGLLGALLTVACSGAYAGWLGDGIFSALIKIGGNVLQNAGPDTGYAVKQTPTQPDGSKAHHDKRSEAPGVAAAPASPFVESTGSSITAMLPEQRAASSEAKNRPPNGASLRPSLQSTAVAGQSPTTTEATYAPETQVDDGSPQTGTAIGDFTNAQNVSAGLLQNGPIQSSAVGAVVAGAKALWTKVKPSSDQ